MATGNEFAPNLIGEGAAARLVEPAPTPEGGELSAKAEIVEQDAEEVDFLEYVHGDLKRTADKLGYDLKLIKRGKSSGPTMFYDRVTRIGKVFNNIEEAGPDFMSGDELQAAYARERAE